MAIISRSKVHPHRKPFVASFESDSLSVVANKDFPYPSPLTPLTDTRYMHRINDLYHLQLETQRSEEAQQRLQQRNECSCSPNKIPVVPPVKYNFSYSKTIKKSPVTITTSNDNMKHRLSVFPSGLRSDTHESTVKGMKKTKTL